MTTGKTELETDIKMWHDIKANSEKTARIAGYMEYNLISDCRFYEFDESFEEYCHSEKWDGKPNFDSKKECYKCKLWEYKKKTIMAETILDKVRREMGIEDIKLSEEEKAWWDANKDRIQKDITEHMKKEGVLL